MILDRRRREILDVLRDRGYASLQELVAEIGASESTIRRDLESLDTEGAIRRMRGGAMLTANHAGSPPGEMTESGHSGDLGDAATVVRQLEQKRAIGRAAAAVIDSGQTVLIDGGSTTLEVARSLIDRAGDQARPGYQVVTNSLPVVELLFGRPPFDVVMLGGLLDPKTGVALGPITDAAIETFRVQTLVLGCGGVRGDALYNRNSLLVDVERRMLDAADCRILVADSSKFGHAELVRLCTLDRIDRLVTDDGLPDHWRKRIAESGVDLCIAASSAVAA